MKHTPCSLAGLLLSSLFYFFLFCLGVLPILLYLYLLKFERYGVVIRVRYVFLYDSFPKEKKFTIM